MELSQLLPIPTHWTKYQSEEVIEINLDPYTSEYIHVQSHLKGTSRGNLIKIVRVQNPFLYHRYLLRKLEYSSCNIPFQELELLHATAAENIPSIILNNLDWRLVNRAKFGKGVSFSPFAIYANKQCSKLNGLHRAMILAKVLVGNKFRGTYSTKIPPRNYDTTCGNGYKVFVKYYDDEFYPEYVAYYENFPSMDHLLFDDDVCRI